MKLIVMLALLILTACHANKETNPVNSIGERSDSKAHASPVFHIKAKYWYECQWQVIFTNDNFDSEETIMNCWDASSKITGNDIVHQLMIFKDEGKAIAFAKKFTTYQKCRAWNDSVSRKAERLAEYRSAHPIEKQEVFTSESYCKDEEGKETMVY